MVSLRSVNVPLPVDSHRHGHVDARSHEYVCEREEEGREEREDRGGVEVDPVRQRQQQEGAAQE